MNYRRLQMKIHRDFREISYQNCCPPSSALTTCLCTHRCLHPTRTQSRCGNSNDRRQIQLPPEGSWTRFVLSLRSNSQYLSNRNSQKSWCKDTAIIRHWTYLLHSFCSVFPSSARWTLQILFALRRVIPIHYHWARGTRIENWYLPIVGHRLHGQHRNIGKTEMRNAYSVIQSSELTFPCHVQVPSQLDEIGLLPVLLCVGKLRVETREHSFFLNPYLTK